MVGTGKNGRIFMVRQDRTYSLLLRVEADQVTSITSPDGDSVLFTTSNPARVYRLQSGRRTEGLYRSPVEDTTTISSMGKIRWEARVPAGTVCMDICRIGACSSKSLFLLDCTTAARHPARHARTVFVRITATLHRPGLPLPPGWRSRRPGTASVPGGHVSLAGAAFASCIFVNQALSRQQQHTPRA